MLNGMDTIHFRYKTVDRYTHCLFGKRRGPPFISLSERAFELFNKRVNLEMD